MLGRNQLLVSNKEMYPRFKTIQKQPTAYVFEMNFLKYFQIPEKALEFKRKSI